MNKPKLKLVELFNGISAQYRGMINTGLFDVEMVATSDIDKEVIVECAAIHCGLTNEMIENYSDYPSREEMAQSLTDRKIGYVFEKDKQYDWFKLSKRKKGMDLEKYWLAAKLTNNLGDVSKIDLLPECDVLTFSSPCFVAGTKVLTDNGYKNIEDITLEDKVLTHNNKYQNVVRTMIKDTDKLIKIKCMQSDAIKCTPNHPFYTRDRYWKYDTNIRYTEGKSKGKEKKIRYFGEPKWIKAENLTKDTYLGIAINQESELPEWNGIDIEYNDTIYPKRSSHIQELNQYFDKDAFWWIIGRYIGDGWIRTYDMQGVTICCDKSEENEITEKLDELKIKYTITEERTVKKIAISKKELAYYCQQFGHGAENKHLTKDIFNLPISLLKAFLDGYWSADGCYTQDLFKASSVSKELIYGLGQCIAKVYHRPFRVGHYKRKPTCMIEGRTVNQKDSYNISFKKTNDKQDHAFYEDGYIWCPISKIEQINETATVYNLEVEEDNSYTVQNIIVHNCTDYSVAGKQEGSFNTCNCCGHKFNPFDYDVEERYNCPECGSDDIQGTRSGLLKEVERLLVNSIKAGQAPKYLLQENVDALVSKKFKPDFDAFCRRLENLNYNVYWTVLNAKECGVPQNRKRMFMIGIRKDIDNGTYTFPQPFDTGVRLKDILEKEVDEKYYINTERAENLIKQLVEKGQLNGQRECADSTINNPNTKDISNCITARYDASIQNKPSIGLVVAEPNQKRLGGLWDGETKHQAGSVWDKDGVAPTLDTCQGGGRIAHIIEDTKPNEIKYETKWKQLGETQYKVSNTGIVANTSTKSKVEIVDGKVTLNINGKERTTEVSKLVEKLFPNMPICVGNTTPSGKSQCNAVYSTEGVSQTLCAGTHGYATGNILEEQSKLIKIKQATKDGYIECEVPGVADLSFPNSTTRRGRVQDKGQTCPTLTAAEGGIRYIESLYRIRKLTPRETFALMGFTFEDCDKCWAVGQSNSALYKACGNSIVTNCISLLFEHLYKAQYDSDYVCTDEKWANFINPQS